MRCPDLVIFVSIIASLFHLWIEMAPKEFQHQKDGKDNKDGNDGNDDKKGQQGYVATPSEPASSSTDTPDAILARVIQDLERLDFAELSDEKKETAKNALKQKLSFFPKEKKVINSTHERFTGRPLTLTIHVNGKEYIIKVSSKNQLGYLRQQLTKKMGLPEKTKFRFSNRNHAFKKVNFSMNTHIYTLGIEDGDHIDAVEDTGVQETVQPTPAQALETPLSAPSAVAQNSEVSEDEEVSVETDNVIEEDEDKDDAEL